MAGDARGIAVASAPHQHTADVPSFHTVTVARMSSNPVVAWHQMVDARDARALDALLADTVVFHSPVMHTPQAGKALTVRYLTLAMETLCNASFRYTRELVGEHDAALEFETEVDGVRVNGVDMLAWNDTGQIVDVTVMLRPLKAVNLVHQRMAAALQGPASVAGS